MTVDGIHTSAIDGLVHPSFGCVELTAEALDRVDELQRFVSVASVEVVVQQLGQTGLHQREAIEDRA